MDNLMTTYGTSEMLPSRRSSCSDASSRPSATSLAGRAPAPPQPVPMPAAPPVVSKPAVPAGDLQPAGPTVPVPSPAGSPAVARQASEPGSPVKGAGDLTEREDPQRKSEEVSVDTDTGLHFVEGQHRAAQKAKQELLLARNLQQASVSYPGDALIKVKSTCVLSV